MSKLYRYVLTDEDREELRNVLDAAGYKEPEFQLDDYYEKKYKWIEFFSEDVFEEDCI